VRKDAADLLLIFTTFVLLQARRMAWPEKRKLKDEGGKGEGETEHKRDELQDILRVAFFCCLCKLLRRPGSIEKKKRKKEIPRERGKKGKREDLKAPSPHSGAVFCLSASGSGAEEKGDLKEEEEKKKKGEKGGSSRFPRIL